MERTHIHICLSIFSINPLPVAYQPISTTRRMNGLFISHCGQLVRMKDAIYAVFTCGIDSFQQVCPVCFRIAYTLGVATCLPSISATGYDRLMLTSSKEFSGHLFVSYDIRSRGYKNFYRCLFHLFHVLCGLSVDLIHKILTDDTWSKKKKKLSYAEEGSSFQNLIFLLFDPSPRTTKIPNFY